MPSLTDFISENSAALANALRVRLKPVHDPETDCTHPVLNELLRPARGLQSHIATASAKAFKSRMGVIFGMAMGTGKTFTAIATTYLMSEGKPYSSLVVSPPHLLLKWRREIEATVPNAVVVDVNGWEEWLMLARNKNVKLKFPTFFLTPLSVAKLGARWIPAVFTKKRLGGSPRSLLCCPECFKPITYYKMGEDKNATMPFLRKRKRYCRHCKSACWQNTKPHKVAPSRIIKKHLNKWFDTVICDECFVGDTLVMMSSHQYKTIDSINPGESVLSWDGERYVERTVTRAIRVRRSKQLVRVRTSLGYVDCTADHKFYTSRGKIKAIDLTSADCLLSLRDSIHQASKEGGVLREEMCFGGAVAKARLQGKYDEENEGEGSVGCYEGEVDCKYKEAERQPRSAGKEVSDIEGEAVPGGARRKRKDKRVRGNNEINTSIFASNSKYEWMSWSTDSLQIRYCQRVFEGSHRGGWGQPRLEESAGSGSKERGVPDSFWMEDSESEKQGCDIEHWDVRVESVELLHDEHEYVYDLEVEDTHCYFAGGVLVSNCHMMKAGDTLAGESFSHFVSAGKKVLVLTGTLIAGRSIDLMPTLFRLFPQKFVAKGIGWNDLTKFNKEYGRIETASSHRQSIGKGSFFKGKHKSYKKVMPGVMPSFYRDFLADCTVFCTLKEMMQGSGDLPKLVESSEPIEMSQSMAAEYACMKEALVSSFLKVRNEDPETAMRFVGRVAETLATWPDDPAGWDPIGYTDRDGIWHEVYRPKDMEGEVTPKEKRLVETILRERSEGRQVWVFVTRDATAERLLKLMVKSFISCAHLTTAVPPVKREDWIMDYGPGMDCILSHPELVQTGLDFFGNGPGKYGARYNFSTIIHY